MSIVESKKLCVYYSEDGNRCYHSMNPTRECSVDHHCMYAVFEEFGTTCKIRPCGLVGKESCQNCSNQIKGHCCYYKPI